jgi:glucan phosphoethanolaminetransferase (alkaline phosphatase superfamily)
MLQSKFWQGFFAIGPIAILFLGMIAYFIFLFFMFQNMDELEYASSYSNSNMMGNLGLLMLYVLIAILVAFGSLIFYIVHAANNPNLRENNMLLIWILLFVFANGIGQLIYWIIEIVNKRAQKTLNP